VAVNNLVNQVSYNYKNDDTQAQFDEIYNGYLPIELKEEAIYCLVIITNQFWRESDQIIDYPTSVDQ